MEPGDLTAANKRIVTRLAVVVLAMFGFGFALVSVADADHGYVGCVSDRRLCNRADRHYGTCTLVDFNGAGIDYLYRRRYRGGADMGRYRPISIFRYRSLGVE